MKTADVMKRRVVAAGPETPVSTLAQLLLDNRIGAVPVVDRAGRAVGIGREGDLLGALIADDEQAAASPLLGLGRE